MADERIKDFTGEVLAGQIQALLDTLYLAVDDTSFSDAKKLLLKTILTNAVVDANTNNYQAITPKAFYDSVMTTVRRGIGILATDADIISKSGTGLLASVNQAVMQSQWLKDWYAKNGTVSIIYSDNADYTAAKTFQFIVNYHTASTVNSGTFVDLTPSQIPAVSSIYFKRCYINLLVGSPIGNPAGSYAIDKPATGNLDISLGPYGISLRMTSTGRIGIYLTASKSNLQICFNVQAIRYV